MAGEPAFFELGVEDDEKGRAFYSSLFGWDFRPGPNQGYEIGTAGLPGGIHGGDKGAAPYLFFAVDDMDAAAARVVELGGAGDRHGHRGRRRAAGQDRPLQALRRRPGLAVRPAPAPVAARRAARAAWAAGPRGRGAALAAQPGEHGGPREPPLARRSAGRGARPRQRARRRRRAASWSSSAAPSSVSTSGAGFGRKSARPTVSSSLPVSITTRRMSSNCARATSAVTRSFLATRSSCEARSSLSASAAGRRTNRGFSAVHHATEDIAISAAISSGGGGDLLSCHGVRIRGPSAVIAIVNSKWAASEPSCE